MRKSYASNIIPEKFGEIHLLLQNVSRRTRPTTVDLYEVCCTATAMSQSLLHKGCVGRWAKRSQCDLSSTVSYTSLS